MQPGDRVAPDLGARRPNHRSNLVFELAPRPESAAQAQLSPTVRRAHEAGSEG
jgi:hypothetical protein